MTAPQSIKERLARAAASAGAGEGRSETDFRKLEGLEHWRHVCPARYQAATLETLVSLLDDEQPFSREVFDAVMGWLEDPASNVAIAGDPGVGKSWLASVLARELAARYGWHNEFVPLERMFEEAKNSAFGSGGLGPLERYIRAHCAVIDDVGSGRDAMTQAQEAWLYLVVNERWLAKRPTIVTTNLTPASFNDFVGVRIAERVGDGMLPIVLTGRSRRTPPGKSGVAGGAA